MSVDPLKQKEAELEAELARIREAQQIANPQVRSQRKVTSHHIGLGVLGCFGLLLIFAVLGHHSGDNSDDVGSAAPAQSDSKLDIYADAEVAVERYLKAPSTADFAYMSDASITQNADGSYTIVSFVDSQNSFGAKIRTYFTIVMRKSGSDWIADAPPRFVDNQ